jgi:glycyl-tRNA synthetase
MSHSLDTLISFAKRRGFVYPSSEIYGGFAAVYDFGPYGVELANNIKAFWWKEMVQKNKDIVGLDSAIFMSPRIWEASGHVGGFSDPLAECKQCHTRVRVDQLLEEVGVQADEKMSETEINALFGEHMKEVSCPKCGGHEFTDAKSFNLLVQSNLGDFTNDGSEPVYLRGETCQGIYVNYKNIMDSMRVKVPFGIAQIGKAFRNEITARQFIFRTREFEQMEMQFLVAPADEMTWYDVWKERRWKYYEALGINMNKLRFKQHENLVFYAKEAYDIEYEFPFGFKEVEGIHARGNYDLTQHTIHSGKKLTYRDPHTNEEYTPHIVETSAGVGRALLMLLSDAYTEEDLGDGDIRVVLKLKPALAPITAAVLPLMKKEGMPEKADEVFALLSEQFRCEYDDSGSIGKRYRRQDEIGTPFCITIDFDTLTDGTVTVRHRDSMEQERVAMSELMAYIKTHLTTSSS